MCSYIYSGGENFPKCRLKKDFVDFSVRAAGDFVGFSRFRVGTLADFGDRRRDFVDFCAVFVGTCDFFVTFSQGLVIFPRFSQGLRKKK